MGLHHFVTPELLEHRVFIALTPGTILEGMLLSATCFTTHFKLSMVKRNNQKAHFSAALLVIL